MERSSSSTTRQQQQHHRQSNSIYHTVPGGVNNQLSNRANHIYHNAHTPEHASSEELAAATRIANKDRAFNDSSRDRREHGDGSYSTVEANPQDDDDEARHHSRASGEFEALLGRTPGSGLVLNDSSSDYPPSRPSVADSSYKALDNSYVDESYASSSLDLSDGHDSSGGSSKPRRSEQLQPDDHHLDRVHDRLFASNDTVTQTSRSIFKKQKGKGKRSSRNRERTKEFAKEMVYVTVPCILLSMVGSVLAGQVLAELKTWPVFLRVEELFILVPILLNLKGNLEMNLAARFSTSANIGELDLRQTRKSLIMGNMALLQVQALLVSLLAGIVAFVLGLLSRTGLADSPAALTGNSTAYGVERGGYFECLMVLCASMIAASASSAVVGAFMCSLVVMSRFLKINPDNLATPLAASLGDLLALVILAIVARAGAQIMGTLWSTFIFIGLIGFIATNIYFTLRNAYVQELIWAGWVPLLLALVVSSGTGLVLQAYVNEFRGFGLIAQVVTGVTGNVAAIFVSRISTALHGAKEERYIVTATTLFFISTPILIAFLAYLGVTGQVHVGFAFATSYTLLTFAIMAIALAIAYYLTLWLWSRDYDPDINALPLMSAAIDLVGQLMLAGAFFLAKAFHGDVMMPAPVLAPSEGGIANATSSGLAVSGALRLFA